MLGRGLTFLLAVVAGVLLLASMAAAGGGQAAVVVASAGTQGCTGFLLESLGGTVRGCVPFAGGEVYGFEPAADRSVVIDNWPNGYGGNTGEGTPVWLVHPNGSAVELDASEYDSEAVISADGSKVAFVRTDPSTGTKSMYVVNTDGSGLRLVAPSGSQYWSAPALSPDGRSLAYFCVSIHPAPRCGPLPDGSYRSSGLMLMNADGTDKRMIVIGPGESILTSGVGSTVPGGVVPSSLSWSPNGHWLTAAGPAASGTEQVFAYRSDGSDLFDYVDPSRQVTRDKKGAGEPQFCGSDHQILYAQGYPGDPSWGGYDPYAYYLINRDGTHRQPTVLNAAQTGNYPACLPPAESGGAPPTVNVMRVTVPAVGALSYAAAKRRLQRAHLHVGTVTHAYSTRILRGHVIAQYPGAGAHAHRSTKQGPPVKLVLSRGPRP